MSFEQFKRLSRHDKLDQVLAWLFAPALLAVFMGSCFWLLGKDTFFMLFPAVLWLFLPLQRK